MVPQTWPPLACKLPPEPARKRIALWRKPKGRGAACLQGGVCLPPRTDGHLRRPKILGNDAAEMPGEAILLAAAGPGPGREATLVARFSADRDGEYRELPGRCAGFAAGIARRVLEAEDENRTASGGEAPA